MSDKMRDRLRRMFRDRMYRRTYMDSFLNTVVAGQIKALREARGLSQKELGEKIKTKQSGISALENVNYSRWSLSTLRKLAEAFDVALVVKFVSFGEAINEVTAFDGSKLNQPSFEEDPAFVTMEQAEPTDSVPRVRSLSDFVAQRAGAKTTALAVSSSEVKTIKAEATYG